MPELPDIEMLLACLRDRIEGQPFTELKLLNPFVLRTVAPRPADLVGQRVLRLWRIGKRIALECEGGPCLVMHLMISGRLRWLAPDAKAPGKIAHALLRFPNGTLALTEASSRKRAGIWIMPDAAAASALDPGGIDPLAASLAEFTEALTAENRTIKRALTNPRRLAGIGNAYSDEILHAARLAPHRLTSSLTPEELATLHAATMETLSRWRDKLIDEFRVKFPGPGDVTAFRPDFAVHGKFGQPCPVCGRPVQRIVYADNETNYCAECQNGGRILADRALSRLLKDDWPRSFGDEE